MNWSRARGMLVAGVSLVGLLLGPVSQLVAPSEAWAQARSLPGVPAGPEVGIDLDKLREIQEQTSALRGLTRTTEVPVRVVDRQEFARTVREQPAGAAGAAGAASSNAARQVSPSEKMLIVLGLLPAEANLREVSA